MPVAGKQADAGRIAAGHHPIAVMLDFVKPLRAGRRLLGGGWEARCDEVEREGTLRYAAT
jgi:hypothetical protein